MKTRVGYEANPNGNLWLKDSTGFGQKMLAKMGWKEGQGLGRTEQGITEAIRVSRKRDNRGVGCSRQWAEEGSAQMDAFSAVLADLNRQHESPARVEEEEKTGADQPIGLEESSRRSRNRLHYAKFTRGKDLSRCSEQALLSIMGPRGVPQEREAEAKDETEAKTEDLGVRHVQSTLSTAEYFAQKMEAMRARLKASASAPDLCESREEETNQETEEVEEEAFSARPTFQLGGDADDDLEDGEISQQLAIISTSPVAIDADDADHEKVERRRRKEERRRRRKEQKNVETEDCVQEEDGEVLEAENEEKEERRKRKEERRRRRKEQKNVEAENCVQEEDGEVLEAENEEKEERRKRKEERRRRRKEQKNAKTEDCVQEEDEKEEEKRRRRRKERRTAAEAEENEEEREDTVSSEGKNGRVEETAIALPSGSDDDNTSKRTKKRKRKNREESSESEAEAGPKKQKVRPSSATMTIEEAASFAFENKEVMQHLEWSAFSTSNLGLVVGYKYASVS